MEMFVLSYANVLCSSPKLCPQVSSTSWLRTCLTKQHVILRYFSPDLCKRNYLYGNLSFYKIQVNHFMTQDEPFGAKIIPKRILWVRGLVPFWVLRHSFLSLEKAMATHSSTLAWKIPWTEEPGRLQSMGSLRVGHDWATSLSLFTFIHWRRKWQPIPVFLPGESQGQRSLVGCRLWGRTESDTTKVT